MAYGGGFTFVKGPMVETDEPLPISSLAVASGDALALGIGSTTWSAGAATTEHWQLKAVATETVTTAATTVNARHVLPGQFWVAETANNSAAADNGDRMLLTDANTVNNTGTDNTSEEACFIQLGVIGAAAEKRVLGFIVFGTGVNPDAA